MIQKLYVRRWQVAFMAVALVCASVVFAYTADASQAPEMQRYIVTFNDAPGERDRETVREQGGEVIYSYSLIPAMAVSVPGQAVRALKNNPRVASIEADQKVYATDIEMDNSWGVQRIGSEAVHSDTTNPGGKGAGARIGIIDSGINYLHPDLNDNYSGGYDFVTYDHDPMDVYGHGTHVAGTACAEDNDLGSTDPKLGVVGVAAECDLYALRVLNDDGVGYETDIMAAIEWSLGREVYLPEFGRGRFKTPATTTSGTRLDVVNLSLGRDGEYLESSRLLFQEAADLGLVIVAAAGNSGEVDGTGVNTIYPAKYPSVIAVGATSLYDNRAEFSSTGPEVELAAPGGYVYSTWNDEMSYSTITPIPVCTGELVDINGDGERDGECYKYGSGTSMASPHVAGAAALVIATGITDGALVRSILQETAEDLGVLGRDEWFGYGLVDVSAAVALAQSYLDPNPAPVITNMQPSDGAVIQGTTVISAEVSDDSAVAHVAITADGVSLSPVVHDGLGGYSVEWTPSTDGPVDIVITATDDAGKSATQQVTVTVYVFNEAPVADAGADQTVMDIDSSGSESVSLDGTGSYDLDPSDSVASYEWFEADVSIASTANPTVDLDVGMHTISLVVTDTYGLSSLADVVVVTVEEQLLDPSTKFVIGGSVMTTSDLNVRETSDGELLGTQPRRTAGTVLDGPVWAGGYWWWKIDYDNSTIDGWSVEDYLRKLRR